jgi:hypothetical protein
MRLFSIELEISWYPAAKLPESFHRRRDLLLLGQLANQFDTTGRVDGQIDLVAFLEVQMIFHGAWHPDG